MSLSEASSRVVRTSPFMRAKDSRLRAGSLRRAVSSHPIRGCERSPSTQPPDTARRTRDRPRHSALRCWTRTPRPLSPARSTPAGALPVCFHAPWPPPTADKSSSLVWARAKSSPWTRRRGIRIRQRARVLRREGPELPDPGCLLRTRRQGLRQRPGQRCGLSCAPTIPEFCQEVRSRSARSQNSFHAGGRRLNTAPLLGC
jgi:hypothetical protein